MRCGFTKRAASVLACAVFVASASVTQAGQDRASINISGRIPPALRLSIAAGPSQPPARVQITGPDSAEILLEGTAAPRPVVLSFEIRTNVAYQLTLSLISSSGCAPEIEAGVVSVEATGPAVIERAEPEARVCETVALTKPAVERTILAGPRVSARGSFNAPGNALRVELRLDPSEAARCGWQSRLRLRLSDRATP